MTLEDAVAQLHSLRDNSESFLDPSEEDSIWHRDIEAIDTAVACLEGIQREGGLSRCLWRLWIAVTAQNSPISPQKKGAAQGMVHG